MLGYRSSFSIYDQADAVRLTDYVRRDLNMDPKRFPPRRLHAAISAMKNELVTADEAAERAFTPPEKRIADVYQEYQKRLLEASALDFDDLLVQSVVLFRDHAEVLARWRARFHHVLVDEFQDTNVAQWELVRMLTEEHRNVMVVGDQDQCLIEGTAITMGDGTIRPIEQVAAGDDVMSCYGSGDFRPARVLRTHQSQAARGTAITLQSGKRIVSTDDHMHFAGFVIGRTPQLHYSYVMWKEGLGFRVGTSRTYTRAQVDTVFGPLRRCTQEHADALWVVGVHKSEAESRFSEAYLAARYGLPTLPFVARNADTAGPGSLVGNQAMIDRLFADLDTYKRGLQLLQDHGLQFDYPHHMPASNGRPVHGRPRRRLSVVLCGDRRGRTPMHRVSLFGYDEEGKVALESIGLSVRPARKGSRGWRFEACNADMAVVQDTVHQISEVLDVTVRPIARLAANAGATNSLPFLPASSVREGMVMVDEAGQFDVVTVVEPVELDRPVYDLDVERTHNFVAEGIVTHNSVYRFRGRGLSQPDAVRRGVPRSHRDRARAELPVESEHPRRRQRGDRQQRGASAQAPLDRADRWRAHHPLPRRGRARRGRVRRARGLAARRLRPLPLR